METLPLLLSALLLGAAHTFETDHLAAVSALVARRPRPLASLLYGLRWALGHGGIVVVVGTGLLLVGFDVPETVGTLLERLVGLSLVVLGAWVVATSGRLHAHSHSHPDGTVHTHLHAHPPGKGTATHASASARHEHGHAATAMGALHGLAGTAPVVALLPLLRGDSTGTGVLFLLLFAVGTAVSMTLYALLAGVVAGHAARRSAGVARGLARLAGVATAGVGVAWMVGA